MSLPQIILAALAVVSAAISITILMRNGRYIRRLAREHAERLAALNTAEQAGDDA